jgi:hypothetical protein
LADWRLFLVANVWSNPGMISAVECHPCQLTRWIVVWEPSTFLVYLILNNTMVGSLWWRKKNGDCFDISTLTFTPFFTPIRV